MTTDQELRSIATTDWVVQSDGGLAAVFGTGAGEITAHLIGQELGTTDPIRLIVQRFGREIHASEHRDLTTAMDTVEEVILDEWAKDGWLQTEAALIQVQVP